MRLLFSWNALLYASRNVRHQVITWGDICHNCSYGLGLATSLSSALWSGISQWLNINPNEPPRIASFSPISVSSPPLFLSSCRCPISGSWYLCHVSVIISLGHERHRWLTTIQMYAGPLFCVLVIVSVGQIQKDTHPMLIGFLCSISVSLLPLWTFFIILNGSAISYHLSSCAWHTLLVEIELLSNIKA